jgi:hypothetical protein
MQTLEQPYIHDDALWVDYGRQRRRAQEAVTDLRMALTNEDMSTAPAALEAEARRLIK